jgi:hypothetical protein
MEQEDNKLIDERREKLKALRAKGIAYPNDFRARTTPRRCTSNSALSRRSSWKRRKPRLRWPGA